MLEKETSYLNDFGLFLVLGAVVSATHVLNRRVLAVPIFALKTGVSVTAQIHHVLQQAEILHGEHDGGREGGGVGGDVGVDIGAVIQEHLHGGQAAVSDGDEQRVEDVHVGVGAGFQEQSGGVNVVVHDGEVKRGAASVLVQPGPVEGEREVDVIAGFNEFLQNVVVIAFGRNVQGAYSASLHPRAARHRDKHGHDPIGNRMWDVMW